MSVVRSYRRQDSAACILATIWQLELQHRTFFLCVKVELQERCVSRLSVAFANVLATIRGQPTGPSPVDKSFRSCLRVGTSGPFCARIDFGEAQGQKCAPTLLASVHSEESDSEWNQRWTAGRAVLRISSCRNVGSA